METNNFPCIENFDLLKKGQSVFLGTHPDARIANFQRKVTIAANHPSQRPDCFRDGYIKFEEISLVFDRHECCLVELSKYRPLTEHTYLFKNTQINRLRFEKQSYILQIKSKLVSAHESEKIVVAEWVFDEATGRKRKVVSGQVDDVLKKFLPELSLPQLKEFAGLFVSNPPQVKLAA